MTARNCRYDKRYFEKWYRDPRHRIVTPASLRRKVALSLAVAEYYLGHPVRTVLDVGCGEGNWRSILKTFRPRLRYTGIDASQYAVSRYGKRRNILRASFGELDTLDLSPDYDLVICSDLLYYVPAAELDRGLYTIVAHMGGVAFLEAYASTEPLHGDTKKIERRDAAFYRRLFRKHRLISCGPHCYVSEALKGCVTDLERGGIE